MKVSVCVPTYNCAPLLGETLESILAQGYSDFELIVSDNASTDDTEEVVRKYRDRRIVYQRHPVNVGYTRNVRSCIEKARGEYVAVLCADDYWTPDFLEKTVAAVCGSSSITLAYSGFYVRAEKDGGEMKMLCVDRPVRSAGLAYAQEEYRTPRTLLSGHVFRREVALRVGSFADASFRLLPDLLHRLRVAVEGEVAYVAQPLVVYRLHGESLTSRSAPSRWIAEGERVRRQMLRDRRLRNVVSPSSRAGAMTFMSSLLLAWPDLLDAIAAVRRGLFAKGSRYARFLREGMPR